MARHYRRGHWVNSPTRRGTKNSGWVIAGFVAVALWLITSGGHGNDDGKEPGTRPSTSSSAAPAQQP